MNVAAIRAHRLLNSPAGNQIGSSVIEFIAGTDRILKAARWAVDLFISTIKRGCHRSRRNHKRLCNECPKQQGEDESEGDGFQSLSKDPLMVGSLRRRFRFESFGGCRVSRLNTG